MFRIPLALTIAALLMGGPAHAQLRIGMPSGFTGAVAAGVKETWPVPSSTSTRSTPAAASTARRSS